MKINIYNFLIIVLLLFASNCELINDNLYTGRTNAIVRAIKNISPSVIAIRTQEIETTMIYSNSFWDNFFNPSESKKKPNWGSGLIYSKDGYIITNAHVVEHAIKGTIVVYLFNGNSYNAELVGYDKLTDIALLKIKASDLDPADIEDSNHLMVGEWAIALGNPQNLFMNSKASTATAGIISGINVDFVIKDGGRVYQNMIQTDASIKPGNSGGPLSNSRGEVIGINTFIMTGDNYSRGSIGIGFSIPINNVKDIVSDIKRYGKVKRSYSTGLHVQPIDPTIQKYLRIPIDRGVIVTDVEKNSAAEKAGIKIRDVIYAVDNKYISSARDIKEIIKEGLNKSGDFISLSIYRGEEKINLRLQLEEPKDNWPGY